jgi:hypothetical protein
MNLCFCPFRSFRASSCAAILASVFDISPYYQSVVFIIGVFKSPLSAAVVTLCILVNQSSALWMTAVNAAETLEDFYHTA